MAERTPLYMDINNVYSGDEFGLPNRDFVSEGAVGSGDLLVTAGTGNSVNVAAGAVWVVGDTDTVNQPTYREINDAVVNKGISPDPTNPRIVRVVLQINDATFAGVTRNGVITAIHGTPAASPVAPALPASAILLADVLVPANAASSAAYTFTDSRQRSVVGGGQSIGVSRILFDSRLAAAANSIAIGGALSALLGTYSRLELRVQGRSTSAVAQSVVALQFNGDTLGNYFWQQVSASAAAVTASEGLSTIFTRIGLIPGTSIADAAMPGLCICDIYDWGNTSYKTTQRSRSTTVAGAGASGTTTVADFAGWWNSAAAVTAITLLTDGANFAIGTRITLIGHL